MAESGARQDQTTPFGITDAKRDAGRNEDGRRLRGYLDRLAETGVQGKSGRQGRNVMREAPAPKPRIEDFELDFERHQPPPRPFPACGGGRWRTHPAGPLPRKRGRIRVAAGGKKIIERPSALSRCDRRAAP